MFDCIENAGEYEYTERCVGDVVQVCNTPLGQYQPIHNKGWNDPWYDGDSTKCDDEQNQLYTSDRSRIRPSSAASSMAAMMATPDGNDGMMLIM